MSCRKALITLQARAALAGFTCTHAATGNIILSRFGGGWIFDTVELAGGWLAGQDDGRACTMSARPIQCRPGAEHTLIGYAVLAPTASGASSRPDISSGDAPARVFITPTVSGWQGRTTARRAAWRIPCVQPLPVHPMPLNRQRVGSSSRYGA